jgi:hypothetical protein
MWSSAEKFVAFSAIAMMTSSLAATSTVATSTHRPPSTLTVLDVGFGPFTPTCTTNVAPGPALQSVVTPGLTGAFGAPFSVPPLGGGGVGEVGPELHA